MRKILLLFLLCTSFLAAPAQVVSDQAGVSVLTCGQGSELYSTFGHSAIRVKDAQRGVDVVFNYGTFDFNTPNFYMKFARGKLDYMLSVQNFDAFMWAYQYEKRWVAEQKLNLDPDQIERLSVALRENARPENRYYRYDFFYDNCSTRIRDILKEILGDQLQFDTEISNPDKTFREFTDDYLVNHPWSDFGIDLALGAPADAVPNYYQRMFLPDELMAGIAKATIRKNSAEQPLVAETKMLYQPEVSPVKLSWLTPETLFWSLFALTAIFTFFGPSRVWLSDYILFTATGLLGLLICFLWFATDHSTTAWNFNLLWATPTWLAAAYFLKKKKGKSQFFFFHGILGFAIMIFWILIPQNLHEAVIPIILMLTIRSWSVQKGIFVFKKNSVY